MLVVDGGGAFFGSNVDRENYREINFSWVVFIILLDFYIILMGLMLN